MEKKSKQRAEQLAEAKRFLWHFQPPWRDEFSHDPWWNSRKEMVTIHAVLWELFRRNPDLPTYFEQFEADFKRDGLPIGDLAKHGWDQIFFQKLGVVHRKASDVRLGITGYRMSACYHQSWVELSDGHKGIWIDCLFNSLPPQPGVSENAVSIVYTNVSGQVEKLEKEGKILIAVDPRAQGLGKLVEELVSIERQSRNIVPVMRGKPRIGQWLEVIYQFEKDQLAGKGLKRHDQLFAKYRRIVRKRDWSSDRIVSS